MDALYARAVALAVPVFLTLIAVELIADRWRRTYYYHLADSINSLSCGILSTGMRVFFGFIGLYTYERALSIAPWRLPADHWAVWIFAFVFFDLCYYWNHRLGHSSGLFWASHVVHHQSEEFNLTTALRQPGTGSFTAWIFYLPMALCGVPARVLLLVGVAQLFYQFWPHTRLIGKLGVLDRWVQTPSNHRVHHAQNDIYLDKNYVGVFMLWDHLFGSYQEELESEPCIYGIRGQLHSWNPIWANLHYYVAMAKDSWHARRWADKARIWLGPPGWRPADVAARTTKAAYDPHRDFVRYDPSRRLALSWYVLVQFVVLTASNSHFLAVLPKQGMAANLAYFAFIGVSLATLGGLLENRGEFAIWEAGRLALAATIVLVTGGWFGFAARWAAAGVAGFAIASIFALWTACSPSRTRAAAL
ncbi:MAG: sterol desaturase family protein [Acidobacteria bacterium]|nr:sterol desaturase family protein [Acidobacteriota bacterium]